MTHLPKQAAILSLGLLLSASGAQGAQQGFSAYAVSQDPGREIQVGKLHVRADGASRFEYHQAGRPVIEIRLPKEAKLYVLFPLTRSYLTMALPKSATQMEQANTPCGALTPPACLQEGEGQLNGFTVQRWSLVDQKRGLRRLIWWDPNRKMILRDHYSDGRIIQANLLGDQPHETLKTEVWETLYLQPSGRFDRMLMLYSPKLGRAVRQWLPNGALRELRNITVTEPAADLFQVPEGYTLITPPKSKPTVTPPQADALAQPPSASAVTAPPLPQPGRDLAHPSPATPTPKALPQGQGTPTFQGPYPTPPVTRAPQPPQATVPQMPPSQPTDSATRGAAPLPPPPFAQPGSQLPSAVPYPLAPLPGVGATETDAQTTPTNTAPQN